MYVKLRKKPQWNKKENSKGRMRAVTFEERWKENWKRMS